jgi:Trp operon repressor
VKEKQLSTAQIAEIRELLKGRLPKQQDIAKMYGVSCSYITAIKQQKKRRPKIIVCPHCNKEVDVT